jgi:hypothetical protein
VVRGFLLLPLNLYWMRKYVGISAGDYLRQLSSISIATGLMAVVVLGLKLLLASRISSLGLLVAETAAGVATVVAALWLLDRPLFHEVGSLAAQAIPGGERLRRRVGAGRSRTSDVPGPAEPAAPQSGMDDV